MHDRHEVGATAECRAHGLQIAGAAPFPVHARHRGAISLEHAREPIAEVAVDDGHGPQARAGDVGHGRLHARRSGTRHGQASAPSGARNSQARRPRISSRIRIISGSRWLRTGAPIASMMRGATGLGPGPRSRRSGMLMRVAGALERGPDLVDRRAVGRSERRPRRAAGIAGEIHRGLQARHTVDARHEPRDGREPALQLARLGVPSGAHGLVKGHAELRRDAGHRQDAARRPEAERRVERRRGTRDHRESAWGPRR
jgi:hypothetical protein